MAEVPQKVGHPVHVLPQEYIAGGFVMGELLAMEETLKVLEKGEGPEYDVLVATYPRSGQCCLNFGIRLLTMDVLPGTARLVEICWLLMNDIDLKKAKEIPQGGRHVFLDLCDPTFKSVFGKPLPPGNFPLAKTHLPVHMMEKHVQRPTKIIVSMRNPKQGQPAWSACIISTT
jgi:hypothetical protein